MKTETLCASVSPVQKGLVVTDMAKKSGAEMGFEPDQIPGAISPEQCGNEYADLIVKATRAEHGGKFWGQGMAEPIPW